MFIWRNRAKLIDEEKSQKGLYNSKLFWTVSYFTFYNYWMYFNFCVCFSICFLVCVPIGITSSVIGLKICAVAAGIKKYKSIIKKKKKKYDKIVLLAKSKLDSIEVVFLTL